MLTKDCKPCGDPCQSVFDRVVVRHYIKGGTVVLWELLDTFTDPNPLLFQLQVGTTSNPLADDWEDVGLPVENQYTAIDPEQRVWGKTNFTHYRVKLTSPLGVYYSTPTNGLGVLSRADWKLARELIRQRKMLYRKGHSAQNGYLLKRRWTGQRCPTCLDVQTQECRNPDCPDCYGTGYRCGYYYPISCVWAMFTPKSRRTQLDGGQGRGTVDDIVVQADMLMTDLMAEADVFVAAATDDRYYIHKIDHSAEVRGVPISGMVEMRPIPFTSIVYEIPIPQKLAELAEL